MNIRSQSVILALLAFAPSLAAEALAQRGPARGVQGPRYVSPQLRSPLREQRAVLPNRRPEPLNRGKALGELNEQLYEHLKRRDEIGRMGDEQRRQWNQYDAARQRRLAENQSRREIQERQREFDRRIGASHGTTPRTPTPMWTPEQERRVRQESDRLRNDHENLNRLAEQQRKQRQIDELDQQRRTQELNNSMQKWNKGFDETFGQNAGSTPRILR